MGAALGGITTHLENLRKATSEWLTFEDKNNSVGQQDALLLNLALENKDTPEMPEALAYMRECRALGLPFWDGGLYETPTLMRQELLAVISAENEFYSIKAINQRLADEYAQSEAEKKQQGMS